MTKILACIAATRIGKILLGLWLLALLVFIIVPVVGWFQDEFLGSLAFVILPVAILLNASILLAQEVKRGSVEIAKVAWIGIAAVVLLITLSVFDGKESGDIWIFHTWAMLILSFPAGLAVSAVHYTLDIAFLMVVETSYLLLTLEWFVYFVFGYIQWFVLLPWLWRRKRACP